LAHRVISFGRRRRKKKVEEERADGMHFQFNRRARATWWGNVLGCCAAERNDESRVLDRSQFASTDTI